MSKSVLAIVVAFGLVGQSSSMAEAPELSLTIARQTATRNHPRISVAELKALAAKQVAREVRAGYYPSIAANAVAVGTANDNTRLAAIGGLNNPSIFERNAEGLTASQLLTDFGRTANLSASARLKAAAEEDNVEATREQLLLETDAAYFGALQAQSIARVAHQAVTTRRLFLDQVTALASNKLRSELDVEFARVNLEDAQLLLSRSSNDVEAAFAQLSSVMGLNRPQEYRLVEPQLVEPLSTNSLLLIEQALRNRPELMRLRNEREAELKFARAERDSRFPTVAAVGSAGVVPVHSAQLPDNYAAGGVTITVPLFAGGLYTARQKEAELRAEAASQSLRERENDIVRDVRVAWLNAQNSLERLHLTRQLLDNANRSYELAEARYKNGVSSIVELNQAQLNKISAEISLADTTYEYFLRRSNLSYQTGTLR